MDANEKNKESAQASIEDPFSYFGDALEENSVSTLWHYTTLDGLLGILREGAIWATNFQSVNDRSEIRYILDRVDLAQGNAFDASELAALGTHLRGALLNDAEVYISSFCEDGDLLSQWRGYSGNAGVAIGFEASALANRVHRERDAMLLKVEYDEGGADRAAAHVGQRAIEIWRRAFPDGIRQFAAEIAGGPVPNYSKSDKYEEIVQAAAERFRRMRGDMFSLGVVSIRHKHPSFSEEREWRLVSPGLGARSGNQYRISSGEFVPYGTVKFQDSPADTPIWMIRLGPGVDAKNRAWSFEHLLRGLGYRNIDVDVSSVPLRW